VAVVILTDVVIVILVVFVSIALDVIFPADDMATFSTTPKLNEAIFEPFTVPAYKPID